MYGLHVEFKECLLKPGWDLLIYRYTPAHDDIEVMITTHHGVELT
jgi:hypothetical protein